MNKELVNKFTSYISKPNRSKDDLITSTVKFLRHNLKIFSIAIRIKDGKDFPYYFTIGFSERFVKLENFLCCNEDTCSSHLACVCGGIISKTIDPEKLKLPCYTKKGSFFTNSTTELLKNVDNVGAHNVRGTCVKTGYKSMAIIPITYMESNIGLIQLNDFEENKLDLETIESMEVIGEILGATVGGLNILDKPKDDQKRIIRENIEEIAIKLRAISNEILSKY